MSDKPVREPVRTVTKVDEVFALMRRCRAFIVKQLQADGLSNDKIAHYLTLTTKTMTAFINCVDKNGTGTMLINDVPKYMFEDKPVKPDTWMELQRMQLDTYHLDGGIALLIDPVTRKYCYVFWDEADQCSNPCKYMNEVMIARRAYMAHLEGK